MVPKSTPTTRVLGDTEFGFAAAEGLLLIECCGIRFGGACRESKFAELRLGSL